MKFSYEHFGVELITLRRVMLPSKRVKTSRLEVEFAEQGSGAQTVVFLHGNFGSWRWWEQALASLPEGVRGLAMTMRGCKGTRGDGGDYSVDGLAEDVESFAQAMQLERFHLVGHSLGGAIALEYALRHPERLTGLDLVAPAPGDALESMTAQQTHSGWVLRQFSPTRAFDRVMLLTMLRVGRDFGTNRPYFRSRLAAFMPGADRDAVGFERLVSDATRMEPLAILGIYESLSNWDVRSRAHQVTVKTRVLAGALDVLVPHESLEALAKSIPGASFELLEGVGHCPMLERPHRFSAWLAVGLGRGDDTSLAVLERRGVVSAVVTAPPRGYWRRLVGVLERVLEAIFRRPRILALASGSSAHPRG